MEELKLSIEKYYGDYHMDIYKYLIQIKSPDNNGKYWGKKTKFKNPFSYISNKIRDIKYNDIPIYPSYIYNLFEEFDNKWLQNKKDFVKRLFDSSIYK